METMQLACKAGVAQVVAKLLERFNTKYSLNSRPRDIEQAPATLPSVKQCMHLLGPYSSTGDTALRVAAENGHPDIVVMILMFLQQVKPQSSELSVWVEGYLRHYQGCQGGYSAIHLSVVRGHTIVLSVMLYIVPDLANFIDGSGYSVVELALATNNFEAYHVIEKTVRTSTSAGTGCCTVSRRSGKSQKKSNRTISFYVRWFGKDTLSLLAQQSAFYTFYGSMVFAFIFTAYAMCYPVKPVDHQPQSTVNYSISYVVSLLAQLGVWSLAIYLYFSDPGDISICVSSGCQHFPFPKAIGGNNSSESNDSCAYLPTHHIHAIYKVENDHDEYDSNEAALLSRVPSTVTHASYDTALEHICRQNVTFLGLSRPSDVSHMTTTPVSQLFCCHLCRLHRPLRAGHSKLRGTCVEMYDHFCLFLWCDVGKNNFKYFMAYLGWMTFVACPLVVGTLSQYCKHAYELQNEATTTAAVASNGTIMVPFICGFAIWTSFVWLMVATLLCFELFFVSQGITNREYSGGAVKYPYMHNAAAISTGTFLHNMFFRLFPPEFDQCYNEPEMVRLQQRFVSEFSIYSVLKSMLCCKAEVRSVVRRNI